MPCVSAERSAPSAPSAPSSTSEAKEALAELIGHTCPTVLRIAQTALKSLVSFVVPMPRRVSFE